MKRNKIRYQSKSKDKVLIALTGQVYLQYRDDEAVAQAAKGDLALFPQNEALHTTRQGDYEGTGFSGYFKVDVYDGKEWRPVILSDLFPQREHYFGRSERPIDTYLLCKDMLCAMQGKNLQRSYREHYEAEA